MPKNDTTFTSIIVLLPSPKNFLCNPLRNLEYLSLIGEISYFRSTCLRYFKSSFSLSLNIFCTSGVYNF